MTITSETVNLDQSECRKIYSHLEIYSTYIYLFRLKHWDVNNENLHGDFYETKLQNANITMDMFRKVHSIDPDVELFLNDFDIVTKSSHRTVVSYFLIQTSKRRKCLNYKYVLQLKEHNKKQQSTNIQT